ncbi:MAG: signal recognition particle-docking protein FtsY [Firmicutes bacterium]|nr:signal recognition particle-docking protein FtsY [Bacillota bacterium]
MGFFEKLQAGLTKTKKSWSDKLGGIFSYGKIDEDIYEELEDALISADCGVETSLFLTEQLRAEVKAQKISDSAALQPLLEKQIAEILCSNEYGLTLEEGLNIIVMIGVNGAGKTTTVGKLAHKYRAEGKKVLLAAADTFRAAASEQLSVWAQRNNVDIIEQAQGADPGAVVYDAIHASKARKIDLLLIDTAGRLQNKSNLMEELKKIFRIIEREAPEAHLHTFLVLDGGTGQNAIQQAKLFGAAAQLTGLILTKLDGTSKGGAIIGICRESSVPIRFVGVGEGIDDLQEFNAPDFVKAMFE